MVNKKCKKCGHLLIHHINKDEGYRCHGLIYDETIKDSVQCECRLKKKTIVPIMWHHGTCDLCNERFILVLHFGYDTQPKRDYRICIKCIKNNVESILGFI
jgi:hypothetical protein